MSDKKQIIEDNITPLFMNGLEGRMLRMPGTKSGGREILLVYGAGMNIESTLPLVEELRTFGVVTVPDLPGLGGMTSFFKVGEKPTVDNFAAYLAAFIKLRYKHRRVTIVAVDSGLAMVTRMLQRYPTVTKKTDMVIAIGGTTHKHDFQLSLPSRLLEQAKCNILSKRIMVMTRDKAYLSKDLFSLDLTKRRIEIKMFYINKPGRYPIDSYVHQQHLHIVFDKLNFYSTKKTARTLLPSKVKAALR
jgi:pimeloyl-ACP methyl ester carboxylesterase